MVAVRFDGAEGQALKTIQDFGISFGERLGITLTGQQIGSRKTGKADGVMGIGTNSFLEQWLIAAQKAEGNANPDKKFTAENVDAALRFMVRQGFTQAQADDMRKAFDTLKVTEEDSRFARAHTALTKTENPWRVLAADFTVPDAMQRVSIMRQPSNTPATSATTFNLAAATGIPDAPTLTAAAPVGRAPSQAAAQTATPAAAPSIVPVSARSSTTQSSGPLEMDHATYRNLVSLGNPSAGVAAMTAAYKAGYDARLAEEGYPALMQRIKNLQTQDPVEARLAESRAKLKAIDDGIKNTEVTIAGYGKGKLGDHMARVQAEKDKAGFFGGNRILTARETEIERTYANLKETQGYNAAAKEVTPANIRSLRDAHSTELRTLQAQAQTILQVVQGTPINLAAGAPSPGAGIQHAVHRPAQPIEVNMTYADLVALRQISKPSEGTSALIQAIESGYNRALDASGYNQLLAQREELKGATSPSAQRSQTIRNNTEYQQGVARLSALDEKIKTTPITIPGVSGTTTIAAQLERIDDMPLRTRLANKGLAEAVQAAYAQQKESQGYNTLAQQLEQAQRSRQDSARNLAQMTENAPAAFAQLHERSQAALRQAQASFIVTLGGAEPPQLWVRGPQQTPTGPARPS